jgi:hypothetical protein
MSFLLEKFKIKLFKLFKGNQTARVGQFATVRNQALVGSAISSLLAPDDLYSDANFLHHKNERIR